jgi:hypothetical protein
MLNQRVNPSGGETFSTKIGFIKVLHKAKVGDGTSILFCKDYWQSEDLLCDQYPRLFSFAIEEDATVVDLVNQNIS